MQKAIYDKYRHRCAICNKETGFDEGEIDHIKPKSKGGSDNPRNLQWLCNRCNNLKGDRLTNEEVRELLGLEQSHRMRGEKLGQSYKCKVSVSGRALYCGKKRADKSCLKSPNPFVKGKCRELLVSRK